MPEYWDAYDSHFQKIDNLILERGKPLPPNVYHLVCEIAVRHRDGTYLLMQRDFRKHLGGQWEFTAGGSALLGETPMECAKRELQEETGIRVAELTELKRIVHDPHQSLYAEYLCITDCPKDSITLQEGETISYRWVTRAELLQMQDALATSRTIKLLQDCGE